MKKLLLALALLLLPSLASAQCNGVFPNNTACGNISGASNTPRAIPLTSFPANAPGGTTGQIQYNAGSGLFGGFTASGDCTVNTTTGAVTCTKLQNIPVTTTSASTNDVLTYNGSSWLHSTLISVFNAVCSAAPGTCTTFFGYTNAVWYGTLCNGATDDSAHIQAAINAQPASGGVIYLPSGGAQCIFSTTLDFRTHNYVSLIGFGTQGSSTQATNLFYTGSAARAIDLRDTGGITISGVFIGANNASFTGFIIDAGSQTPGSNVSSLFHLTNSVIQKVGSAQPICLNLSEAIEAVIDRVAFGGCSPAIRGQQIFGQSTTVKILNSQFTSNNPDILQCGESWIISGNAFEGDVNGAANSLVVGPTLPCRNITISGNWYGDISTTGGTWLQLTSNAAIITGNRFSGNSGSVAIGLQGGGGYSIMGNAVDNFNIFVSCTTSPAGVFMAAQYYVSVTTQLAAGCTSTNNSNNGP